MNRRQFLETAVAIPAGLAVVGHARAQAPTPACGAATVVQTEGPYFKPASPERQSLIEPSVRGPRIVVEGIVRGTDCQPIPRALLDVWHCDAEGVYDNSGYRCRGHQFTDADGRYRLQTVVPGIYPGRTRHFHVKVQAPGGPVLTTQLYFPDEPGNRRDGIFDPRLVMQVRDAEAGKLAGYDFVVVRARA